MNYGFIYCLGSEAMPGIFKIGMTERAPSQRCSELTGATAAAIPFDLLFYGEVESPSVIEREIHSEFDLERVSENREFFRGTAAMYLDALEKWCDSVAVTNDGRYYLTGEDYLRGLMEATDDEARVSYFIDMARMSGVQLWASEGLVQFSCPLTLVPRWLIAAAATSKSILLKYLPGECPVRKKSVVALEVIK
jgi:hypothetical protein